MTWYTRNLRDHAVYWGKPIKDEWGDQTYPSAANVKCHWKEEAHVFVNASGANAVSKAVVFLDTEVNADGFLLHGSISPAILSPRAYSSAARIQYVEKQPSLRQDVVAYVAYL
jgi:hypothetical protein